MMTAVLAGSPCGRHGQRRDDHLWREARQVSYEAYD